MTGITEFHSKSPGERSQTAHKALADEIAVTGNTRAVADLVDALSVKVKAIQTDAIKVLGEVAQRRPELLAPHAAAIGNLLPTAKGVLLWEGLTVLDGIAGVDPALVRPFRERVIASIGLDSVIARDRAVSILVKLAASAADYGTLMPVLLDVLATAPANQLPSYSEHICPIVRHPETETVVTTLEHRLASITQPAKIKRVQRAIRSIGSRSDPR